VAKRHGHEFVNNLLVRSAAARRPLLFVWQPDSMCGRLADQPLAACDNNVYVSAPAPVTSPLIIWSPAPGGQCQALWDSPEELHRVFPKFATRSPLLGDADAQAVRSITLKNFRPLPGVKGVSDAAQVPQAVWKAMGMVKGKPAYVGAYLFAE
jgi:hypothetical protein